MIPLGNDADIVGLSFNSSKDGDVLGTFGRRLHSIGPSAVSDLPTDATLDSSGHRSVTACASSAAASSCGSTTASSGHPILKRRSRTFTLTMPSAHRTAALLRKNFTTTSRNIG